jgi:hypothetical protein
MSSDVVRCRTTSYIYETHKNRSILNCICACRAIIGRKFIGLAPANMDRLPHLLANNLCSPSAGTTPTLNLPCFTREIVRFLLIHSPSILNYSDFYDVTMQKFTTLSHCQSKPTFFYVSEKQGDQDECLFTCNWVTLFLWDRLHICRGSLTMELAPYFV